MPASPAKRNIQHHFRFFTILIAILIFSTTLSAQAEFKPGYEELIDLYRLPKFKTSAKVASVSSYDRTGGNEDGFNGIYSFIRKEPSGLVLADIKGPGIIYRFHTPTPTDDILEFYFDGESSPRIKIKYRDLFIGNVHPFLSPINGYGVGGYFSYVPIPFKKSCKILLKADTTQFYQINYAVYPDDAGIKSFKAESSEEFPRLDEARKLFSLSGSDISSYVVPDKAEIQTVEAIDKLKPGNAITLFQSDKPGRIVGIRLYPADAFMDKNRSCVIKAYWDNDKEPAINCPVGDFFGYSFGEPATRSLVLGTSENTNYIYLPMPFDKAARIELLSERSSGPGIDVRAEVLWTETKRMDDEGKFYAVWRRENPTKIGAPFTFLKTEGKGHIVGCILQAQGFEPGRTPFFEGDDKVTIDGELTVHGTGSEDFFNGGWYDVTNRWQNRRSFPLSGCLDYKKHLARTGGYRFLLTDALAYKKSIHFRMEHSGMDNKFPTDYTGVTFLYSHDRPTADFTLPPVEKRRVDDPEKIVFTPGYHTPIHDFSQRNASLTKIAEQFGDRWYRYLSLTAEGNDKFEKNHSVAFTCDIPASGRYKVSVEAIRGPGQGVVQIFENEQPVGRSVDLYAPERGPSETTELAELDLLQGDYPIYFNLIGKNDLSTGLGLNLVKIIFQRIDTADK